MRFIRARKKISLGIRAVKFEELETRQMLSASPTDPQPIDFTPTNLVAAASTGTVGLSPADIRHAYGLDQLQFDGTGTTIAIVTAYDNPHLVSSTSNKFATSDLALFDAQFGLPDPPSFTKLNQHGEATGYPSTDYFGSWGLEAALDVEWAHAIAPGASIVLVEAASASASDIFTAVATAASLPGVSVVSMSFGRAEGSADITQNAVFATAPYGVTFVASSGDHGSPGGYPALSPYVLAVGGTTLDRAPDGSYSFETAWSGSGGGTSANQVEPSYQYGVQSSGKRSIPDVALNSDPSSGVAVYFSSFFGYSLYSTSNNWYKVGGTSVAAPSWAGMIAIANQIRNEAGYGPLNGYTETLPALYSLPNADFHDITTGSNGGYSAGPGYDRVTGLGSPIANLLIPDLALRNTVASSLEVNVKSKATVGAPFSVTVSAKNRFGQIDDHYNGNITLTLTNGSGNGQLNGTLTIAAVDGVAHFTDLNIDATGDYVLQVSAENLPATNSQIIDVRAEGVATHLVFGTQLPVSVTAGNLFTVTATAQDDYGTTDLSFEGNVALSFAVNPGQTTLGGSLNVTALGGVATFTNLSISRASSGYVVQASSSSLLSVASNSFEVTSDVATKIVMTSQPAASTKAGVAFNIVVAAQDQFGNIATSFQGPITLALVSNPGATTLLGTLTVNAVDGVATFSGLSLTKAANGYSVQASSGSFAPITSSLFNIVPNTATQLAVDRQPPATVGAMEPFSLRVKLLDQYGNLVPITYTIPSPIAYPFWNVGLFPVTASLTIENNPGGANVSGSSALVYGGYAEFSNIKIDHLGTGYTLRVSSPGLTSVVTSPIEVIPGNAAKLAVTTQPPSTISTASTFSVSVSVQDLIGDLKTNYSSAVTIALANNPNGATLGGTLTAIPVNGVATFTGLSLNKAGLGYTIRATALGLSAATTNPFNSEVGATRVVITTQPASKITVNHSFDVIVSAQDNSGNLASSFNGPISLALSSNPSSGTLAGTLTVSAVNGVAMFSGLSIDNAGTGYKLVATASGLTSGSSSSFAITNQGVATRVTINSLPSENIAGQAFSAQVSAVDDYGAVDVNFTGSILISLGSNPSGATLAGVLSAQAVAGVVTFNSLSISKAATGYSLRAVSAGLPTSNDASFNVVAAPASQLLLTNSPITVSAGSSFGLVVAAMDPFFNPSTTFNGVVSIALANNPNGATLGGQTSVQASNGVATFSDLTLDQVGAGLTLQLTSVGLLPVTTPSITVTPPVPTKLQFITSPPSGLVANGAFGVSVAVEDPFGNVRADYNGSVTLSIMSNPGGAALGGARTATVVNGIATFTGLTLDRAGTGFTLQASTADLTSGQTSAFDVAAYGAPAQIVISTPPADLIAAGSPFNVVVAVEDALGNTVLDYNGALTISLAANPGNDTLLGNASVTAAGGVATFAGMSLAVASGGYVLQINADGLPVATTSTFTITSTGVATHLVFMNQPSPTAVDTDSWYVTVAAEDDFGNVVTSYNDSITLSKGNDPAASSNGWNNLGTFQAVAGIFHSGQLQISTLGSGFTVKATATGLVEAVSTPIQISPSYIAPRLTVTAPSIATMNAPFDVVMKVNDARGILLPALIGQATISLASGATGATLSGTLTATVTDGIATFSGLSLDTVGSNYTFNVSFNGITKTSNTLKILQPATATHVVVFTQPPTTLSAGSPFGLTVRLVDDFGNLATSSSSSVTLSLNDNPGGATLGGTISKAFTSGVATFTNLTLNNSGQGYTLKVTSSGLIGTVTNPFDIAPSAAAQVAITKAPPSKVTVGAPFDVVAAIEDTFGNIVTDFNGPVTLAIANNTSHSLLSGATTVNAVNGIATFTGLAIDKPGTTFTLGVSAAGLQAGTSSSFSVLPVGAATRLKVETQPKTEFVAGEPIALTVSAVDDFGNLDSSFNDAVSLTLAKNPRGSSLGGKRTVFAAGGVAHFTAASLNAAATGYTVEASAIGLDSVTSDPFAVVHGQAVQLASIKVPYSIGGLYRTDAGNSVVVSAIAVDAFGNFDPTYQGVATISIANNVNNVPLLGVKTVSIVDGFVSFSSISIQKAGAYSFEIKSDTLNPVTLNPYAYTYIYATPATRIDLSSPLATHVKAGEQFILQASAYDDYGNQVSYTGDVHVSIASGPEGATLSGQSVPLGTTLNSRFNFAGLSLDLPGTYTLLVSADGLTSLVTTSLTVDAPTNAVGLAIVSQPAANVTINAPFGLTVMATDANGALASDFNGPVTLSLANNPTGAILSGVLTVNAVNGVAQFSNISLPAIGSRYSLQISANGLIQTVTNPFNVTALGIATHMVMVTPAIATAGVSFKATVNAVDDFGTIDSSFNGDVHIWVGSGQSLSFSGFGNASHGVYSYSNFVQVPAGTLRLVAHSSSFNDVSSDPITFLPALPRDLTIIHEPPTTVTAGQTFGFTVQIIDVYNGVATSYDAPITISLGNNPGGATLGGTLTAYPINGVVTFTDLTLDKAGDGYTLNLFTPNLPFQTKLSTAISVVPDEATQLVVSAPPPNSVAAGSSFQLTVAALDSHGNLASSFNGVINASLAQTAGGSPLAGNLFINAIDGLATFSNLALANVGSDLNLKVVSSGLTTAISAPLNVLNVVPTASLIVPPDPVRGLAQLFTLQAVDISPADQAAGFTFSIDWGDGSEIETVLGLSGIQVLHAFANVGHATIKVTATDQNGGISDSVERDVILSGARLQPSEVNHSIVDLVWTGTAGADQVKFEQMGPNTVRVTTLTEDGVTINRVETFSGITGQLVADGDSGNDLLDASKLTSLRASLVGGAGDDTLLGGSADDEVWGGADDDVLVGGAGNNHLDAGDGNNTVYGTSMTDGGEGVVNGNNVIQAGDGNNHIYGNYGGSGKGTHDGNNSITVGNGDNTIYGTAATEGAEGGNNSITAGDGTNTIYGNAMLGDNHHGGDNTIIVGNGPNNLIYGNFGADGGEGGNNQIVAGNGGNTIYGNFGGDGGEGGNNIIVSGTGNDTIYGNFNGDGSVGETGGRNIIVGGGGVDTIYAVGMTPGNKKASGSILIAGSTSLLLPALVAIENEWTSSQSYQTRVANISGTGSGTGNNGANYLRPNQTIFTDLAIEQLWGDADDSEDWFFYDPTLDVLHNVDSDEILSSLIS